METGSEGSNLETSKGGKQEGNWQKKERTWVTCLEIKATFHPHVSIEK